MLSMELRVDECKVMKASLLDDWQGKKLGKCQISILSSNLGK
jgi:hypothetical protein